MKRSVACCLLTVSPPLLARPLAGDGSRHARGITANRQRRISPQAEGESRQSPEANLATGGRRKGVVLSFLLYLSVATLGQTQSELLLMPNSELRNDPVATEMILDMVDVWVSDSILPRKREHHHVPGGFMWPLVGIKWQRISEVKQKYVGTVVGFGIGHRRILTENDVNFDVASHLPQYQQLAFQGYEVQKEIGRAKRRIDYTSTPFDSLPTEDNWNRYTLHCEVTPPRDQLDLLDSLFFPTAEGSRLEDHPNFGTVNRQIGVYGAFCSDCNHTCHPEIHPYEWIWWLDLTQPDSIKKWCFALFKEGSNRFPKWSKSASGQITIPFRISSQADSLEIVLRNVLGHPLISPIDIPVKDLMSISGVDLRTRGGSFLAIPIVRSAQAEYYEGVYVIQMRKNIMVAGSSITFRSH